MAKKSKALVVSPRIVLPKRRVRVRTKFTLPLAVVAGFVPLGIEAVRAYQAGGPVNMMERLAVRTTGWYWRTGKFHLDELAKGMGPVIGGFLIHALANKLGVNRALSRAGVPIIRI